MAHRATYFSRLACLQSASHTSAVLLARRRSITVVIPIFNGFEALKQLLVSLEKTYPVPSGDLRFIWVDDCSTDPEIGRLLSTAPIVVRSDSRVISSKENLGFPGAANLGLRIAQDLGSDAVILNSDTRVESPVFSVLQQEAEADSRIASLTPLTNSGTIASLLDFPHGTSRLPYDLSSQEVSAEVMAARVISPPANAPTGVGFCMFIRHEALEEVGLFDEKSFGRGYGEETDWCQRAVAKGWIHRISTLAFVFHAGSQSFEAAERLSLLERNLPRVAELHPNYFAHVIRFVEDDPLQEARQRILEKLAIKANRLRAVKQVLLVLHSPLSYPSGGTEAHCRDLRSALLQAGVCVRVLAPSRKGQWSLTLESPLGTSECERLSREIPADHLAEEIAHSKALSMRSMCITRWRLRGRPFKRSKRLLAGLR